MSFSTHTFQTNPHGSHLGFAFHEDMNEGQKIYFLAKFNEGAKEPKMIAESIFGAIVDSFEHSYSSDPYDRFEEALKAANNEAKKLQAYFSGTPDILVAFFDFHTLYLSQCGASEAYLLRGENMSQITEIPENSGDLFVNILNGKVIVEDSIILSTTRLLRSLTTSQLTDIFHQEDFSKASQDLKHMLAEKSEEDILVTAIGIGKQDSHQSAGFLSKILSKKTTPKAAPVTPIAPEPAAEQNHATAPIEQNNQAQLDVEVPEVSQEAESESDFSVPMPNIKISPEKVTQFFSNLKRQKGFLKIAGAILALFLVIVGIQYINGYESADTQALREELTTARESLRQADNFLYEGDRKSAAEYIESAESSAQKVLNANTKDFRSDAMVILADVKEKRLQAENATIKAAQIKADVGLKADNFDAVGGLQIGDSLYAYDGTTAIKTVRNIVDSPLTLSERATIIAAAPREDQNTMIFLSSTPQLIELRDTVVTPMGTEDESWKNAIAVQNYGRFSYLLDPTQNQIWKYERRRTRYSGATPYNESNTDLSQAISFAIDGAIYILQSDGSIIRFFRGTAVAGYQFTDLPSVPFSGQNIKIFTSQNLDFLYVLDPDNQRILIFDKGDSEAKYRKQIIYELDNVKDFIVDESGQRASLITQDQIYEVSL